MVPALGLGADQHQLEPALPDDAAAEAFEHRAAVAAIGRIGFRAAGLAAIGVGGVLAQAHEVQHVDRARAVVVPELRENLLGRIDVAHARSLLFYGRDPSSGPPEAELRPANAASPNHALTSA